MNNDKFQDNNDCSWSAIWGNNETSGDLNDCIDLVSEYICCEIYSEFMPDDIYDSLCSKEIRKVRQKCLQEGFAKGDDWSIFHHSLQINIEII